MRYDWNVLLENKYKFDLLKDFSRVMKEDELGWFKDVDPWLNDFGKFYYKDFFPQFFGKFKTKDSFFDLFIRTNSFISDFSFLDETYYDFYPIVKFFFFNLNLYSFKFFTSNKWTNATYRWSCCKFNDLKKWKY